MKNVNFFSREKKKAQPKYLPTFKELAYPRYSERPTKSKFRFIKHLTRVFITRVFFPGCVRQLSIKIHFIRREVGRVDKGFCVMKLEATLKTPFKIVTHGVVFKQGKRVSEHRFVQDTFKIYMFAQLYKLRVGRQHTLKKITINTIQVHKYVDQIILVAGRKIYYLQKKNGKKAP